MDINQLNNAYEYLRLPFFEKEAKRLGIPFSYLEKSEDEIKAEIMLGGGEAFINNYATEAVHLTYDYIIKNNVKSPLGILYYHAFFVVESGGHCPFCTFKNPSVINRRNNNQTINALMLKCDAFSTYFINLWNLKAFGRSTNFSMLDGPVVFDKTTYINVQYPINMLDEDDIVANKWGMPVYYLILLKIWEYLEPYNFSPIEARIIIEHLP